jgi:hypothetical protein
MTRAVGFCSKISGTIEISNGTRSEFYVPEITLEIQTRFSRKTTFTHSLFSSFPSVDFWFPGPQYLCAVNPASANSLLGKVTERFPNCLENQDFSQTKLFRKTHD